MLVASTHGTHMHISRNGPRDCSMLFEYRSSNTLANVRTDSLRSLNLPWRPDA